MEDSLPQLTKALHALKGEAAYRVQARANELEQAGKSIVHLEIGQPDFVPPSHVLEATHAALRAGHVRYTNPLGTPELRRAVAEHVSATRGVPVSPHMVGITPGTKTAIFLCMAAVLEKGDEVIYPDPGYPTYSDVARLFGATLKPIPFSEANGFDIDLEKLRGLLNARTKLVILNSPSNPLGGVLQPQTLAQLPALFEACGASPWVLSDEIYSRLTYDGLTRAPSIYSAKGMHERTFLLDGFSKIYAMTGWRLGYVVFPERLEKFMDTLFVNSFACASSFAQQAGITALTGPQDAVQGMIKEFERRRNFVVDALNSMPGVTCHKPQGAFYVFPNVKGLRRNSAEIAETLLEKHGVALLSGAAFGEQGEGYLRISYANSMENLKEGMQRVGAYFRTLS